MGHSPSRGFTGAGEPPSIAEKSYISRCGRRESEGGGRGVRQRARYGIGKPRPTGVVSRTRSISAPTAPHLSKAAASPKTPSGLCTPEVFGDAGAKRRCMPSPERQPIKKPRSDLSPRPRGGGLNSASART